jgi:HSP20 family protein
MADTKLSREQIQPKEVARRESALPSRWGLNSFDLMNHFADEMDRLFDDFGFSRGLAPRGIGNLGQSGWSPQIEVSEREGNLVVCADLPGLKKEDIELQITDNALTIRGERRQQSEDNREGFYRSERSYGSFFRSIPLPEGVDAENATASFRDGVLEVSVPMPQRAERSRRIEIGEGITNEPQPRAKKHTTGR